MAEEEELKATLSDLERSLTRRLLIVARRNPETFLEKAQALELIIDLERKLEAR